MAVKARWRSWMLLAGLLASSCDASVPPGGCSRDDASQCEDAKRGAQRLVDAHAACSAGDVCKVIGAAVVTIPCSGIYCAVAVNARTDEAAFLEQARVLRDRAGACEQCDQGCPIPLCVPPEQLAAHCDTGIGRCTLGQR